MISSQKISTNIFSKEEVFIPSMFCVGASVISVFTIIKLLFPVMYFSKTSFVGSKKTEYLFSFK